MINSHGSTRNDTEINAATRLLAQGVAEGARMVPGCTVRTVAGA